MGLTVLSIATSAQVRQTQDSMQLRWPNIYYVMAGRWIWATRGQRSRSDSPRAITPRPENEGWINPISTDQTMT